MTASKPPNKPWRHHYVPKFLLQQWSNPEGKVALYQKLPTGKVTVDWRVPKSIAFEPELYSFPALGEASATIETNLFGKLDDQAAKIVHRMIETGGDELCVEEMDWWSHFLLSLIIRGPESTRALKAAAAEIWAAPDPQTQADYEALRGPNDPPTVEAWLAEQAGSNDLGGQRLGHRILHSLVMHSSLAERIRQMKWYVWPTDRKSQPFLISDRPVFMSNGLGKESGQILMPLGPRHLFLAFYDESYARGVMQMPAEETVDMARKLMAVRAQKHVYASTTHEREFLKTWLGYEKVSSIGETLAANWANTGPDGSGTARG